MVDFSLTDADKRVVALAREEAAIGRTYARYYDKHEDEIEPKVFPDVMDRPDPLEVLDEVEGETSGTENVTLLQANLPSHAHPYSPTVNNANATVNDPTGAIPAVVNAGTGRNPAEYPAYTKNISTGTAAAQMTGVTGQGIPVPTCNPFW